MQFAKIQIKPGVNREQTDYANSGGWYHVDKVRFNSGLPEKIGGWTPYLDESFIGTARSLIVWSANDTNMYVGIGTNAKYYACRGGNMFDITPIRDTNSLGANTLGSTIAKTTVTIYDPGHAAEEGDYFTISGAVGFNGIPDTQLNGEHQVSKRDNANTISFEVTTPATATGAGGGSAVVVAYQINFGLDSTYTGTGWGAGIWGGTKEVTPQAPPLRHWGEAADTAVVGTVLRIWSQDTYGEDLVFCYNGGPIYYYDVTYPTNRALTLSAAATALGVTAVGVPNFARRVMVSERHTIAFACTPLGATPPNLKEDPMLIRWSDQEDCFTWVPSAENAAGDYRLTVGSNIIAAVRCRQEILVMTDEALYSMRYIGGQYIYGFELIGASATIIGPHGIVAMDDRAFWMGSDGFYAYDGRIQQLDCAVADYVFTRLNIDQRRKVFCGTNTGFGEVTWFYPSLESPNTENDSYVTFNYLDKIWYYGTMDRTAWVDIGTYQHPLGTDTKTHKVYAHEHLHDDASTNPPSPIHALIRSSPFEIQDGYQLSFVTRLIPDITFRNIGLAAASVTMTIVPHAYPGSGDGTGVATSTQRKEYPLGTTSPLTVKIEEFTDQVPIRLRGRALTLQVESNEVGMGWRFGTPRLEIRSDGRK